MYNYTNSQIQILKNIALKFGSYHLLQKLVEECSELTIAISKLTQSRLSYGYIHANYQELMLGIISEMIDVEILLYQVFLTIKGDQMFSALNRDQKLYDFYESEKIRKFEKIHKMMEDNQL